MTKTPSEITDSSSQITAAHPMGFLFLKKESGSPEANRKKKRNGLKKIVDSDLKNHFR